MRKIKFVLGNLLLLGGFALIAASSATTSEERQENIEDFKKGWKIGTDFYNATHSSILMPGKESSDSTAITPANDMALN